MATLHKAPTIRPPASRHENYKLDEADTQDTAGESRTNSSVMYSYGSPHMAKQKQDDQLEHTYSSYVRIRDVAMKTCQKRWMIGGSGERGSRISVLAARHDIYKYIYIRRERWRERERERNISLHITKDVSFAWSFIDIALTFFRFIPNEYYTYWLFKSIACMIESNFYLVYVYNHIWKYSNLNCSSIHYNKIIIPWTIIYLYLANLTVRFQSYISL